MKAVILAGGLGTRLRSVVSDVPKVMAPVAGKPFLHFIIQKLINEQVSRIILAVGYKHEVIKEFIDGSSYNAEFIFSIENEPLGTGGGIKLALDACTQENVFIINGDSFFNCDLEHLMEQHLHQNADISMALKRMKKFERYGTVTLIENRISAFNEKRFCEQGLINAGVYVLKSKVLNQITLPRIFSLEKDVFEKQTSTLRILGFIYNAYFIDIGIPEDYEKSQVDFAL